MGLGMYGGRGGGGEESGGDSVGMRSSDYDMREKENQRLKEEMVKKEEEERMASVMTSGNWQFSLPKPKVESSLGGMLAPLKY